MALKLDKTIFMVHVIKTDGEESKLFFRDYTVSNDAFKDDITLKEVEIHADAKEICDGAFEGCTSLTTVKLPESIDIIRSTAFLGCTSLQNIILPASVSRIECWIDRRIACVTLQRPISQEMLIEHLVSGRGEVEFHQSEEGERSWRDWN